MGTGEPGSRRREGCRWKGNCRGAHRGDEDEREGEKRSRGVRDGESAGGAVVGDRETKKLGGDGVGFGLVQGGEIRDEKVKVGA